MIEYTVRVTQNTTSWFLNGKRHREDGPAFERPDGYNDGYNDGYKAWWINGKRHRADGPAVQWANGATEWWLNGEEVTEADVMSPTKEMTVAELEAVLGHKVKVVK